MNSVRLFDYYAFTIIMHLQRVKFRSFRPIRVTTFFFRPYFFISSRIGLLHARDKEIAVLCTEKNSCRS